MLSRPRHVLALEQLEDRYVPALFLQLDPAGNLIGIFGTPTDPANIELQFTNTDQVQVVENSVPIGAPLDVPGNLVVNIGNTNAAAPSFAVEMNGFDFSSSLSITLGNANNGWLLSVNDSDASTPSTIYGKLAITTGNGDDTVSIAHDEIGNPSLNSLNLFGGLAANTKGGNDTLTYCGITTGACEIHGNVSLSNVNNFEIGLTDFAHVSGSVTLNTILETSIDTIYFRSLSQVDGNVILSTGNEGAPGDAVVMQGTVGRTLSANLGAGFNTFLLDSTAIVNGSLVVVSGNQADAVTLAASSTVLGNVTMVLGNGNNTVLFDTDAYVGGTSITCYTGSGRDDVVYRATAPGAFLNLQLGAGSDTFTFGDPLLVTSPSVARAFTDFGAGNDTYLQGLGIVINVPWIKRNL